MKYTINKEDNTIVFFPIGEIDIVSADDFKNEVFNVVNISNGSVIFDCEALKFVDSTGLGAFVGLNNTFAEKNVKIMLKNINSNIKRIFTITKLNEVITIED